MKIGYRKPSIKKRISSRTTGKVNRKIKRAVNPTYGKKGIGYINDPNKALYNKVYNKTTMDIEDITEGCLIGCPLGCLILIIFFIIAVFVNPSLLFGRN